MKMQAATFSSNQPAPAVFLDKDGTLVEDIPYNVDLEKLRVYPEVVAALTGLQACGYKLIVVSNQPGIAHGYFDTSAVERVGEELARRLLEEGVVLSGFYYCPHHPEGRVEPHARQCDCRKPLDGLLQRAAREHHIDLESSWMIGDILNDVEAGKRAGCRAVLVDRGNETEWVKGQWRKPDATVGDLAQAGREIMAITERSMIGESQ